MLEKSTASRRAMRHSLTATEEAEGKEEEEEEETFWDRTSKISNRSSWYAANEEHEFSLWKVWVAYVENSKTYSSGSFSIIVPAWVGQLLSEVRETFAFNPTQIS